MLPDKGDEISPAKTRFNPRNRSKETCATCIPRLKSFPAEKIKKLDNPSTFSPESIGAPIMQRDPQEVLAKSFAEINYDHGDVTASELSRLHQQTKPPCVPVVNQQQVVGNHQRTDQTSPQSENSQIRQIGSPERQAHVAYAGNFGEEAVASDRSPENPLTIFNQRAIVQNSLARGTKRAFERSSCTVIDRSCDEAAAAENEDQPIGGRNAFNYSQKIVRMQQQQQDANNREDVHLRGGHRVPSRDSSRENRPQIYPQQQQHQQPCEAYRQQQATSQMLNHASSLPKQQHQAHNNHGTQCSYQKQQLSAAQLAPAQGMTSPQDMTMSQMRLTRYNPPVHQRNLGYHVGQSAWPPLDGRWTSHNQQHSCQQEAPQPQGSYYYPSAQNSSFGRRDLEHQAQPVPNRVVANQQPVAHVQKPRQDDGKRMLQFTPDMIRDQELLVSVMRQQGVPADVMRRQFDALLKEQRRHLAYAAQFQRQSNAPDVKYQLLKRRVQSDEKPEWMVHITPPRISYNDLERMKSQQRAAMNERLHRSEQPPEKVGRAMSAQQQPRDYHSLQPKRETNADPPQQLYLRMNPHQWPQRVGDWSSGRDHRVPQNHINYYPYGHHQNAPNNFYHQPGFHGFTQPPPQDFHQYPIHNLPHNLYQVPPEHQETWSKENSATPQTPTDKPGVPMVAENERSGGLVEPSSLLKMRVYKETIRPQKRNNGLQDLDAVQKTLETLRDPSNRKGLEYLSNLARKTPTIRLNGTQEADQVPMDLQQYPVPLENPSQPSRMLSANGLENSRNPNNPAPCVSRPTRLDEPLSTEYPRQKPNPKGCYGLPGERRGSHQPDDRAASLSYVGPRLGSIPCDPANLAGACLASSNMALPYGGAQPYQATQHCYRRIGQNRASHNGGQGDGIAGTQRPDAPDARGIDRAGGDVLGGENPSAEGTATKKRGNGEQSMPGTSPYGRAEIREASGIDCGAHLPAGKSDYVANRGPAVFSPDKSSGPHPQPPMIF